MKHMHSLRTGRPFRAQLGDARHVRILSCEPEFRRFGNNAAAQICLASVRMHRAQKARLSGGATDTPSDLTLTRFRPDSVLKRVISV